MAPRARIAMAVAGVAAAVAVLGPVPRVDAVDAEAIAAAVPEAGELDAWIAAAEAELGDAITPGAESAIAWAGEAGERTPVALVYLHGFSATRQEISPVTERVGKALGANVYFPRLAGHGLPGEHLGRATATEWAEDVVEAVAIGRRLGDRVVLIGTSTGGTLAIDREARAHDPSVVGVVAISPNFGPKNAAAEVVLVPWMSLLLPPVLGEREWEPVNELQGRYWTTRYPTTAIGPMMAAVDSAREAPLEAFPVPALFVWSDGDEVVDPARTEAAFQRLPESLREREKVDCPAGEECHVLAGDILAPHRNDAVTGWLVERIRRWAGLPAPLTVAVGERTVDVPVPPAWGEDGDCSLFTDHEVLPLPDGRVLVQFSNLRCGLQGPECAVVDAAGAIARPPGGCIPGMPRPRQLRWAGDRLVFFEGEEGTATIVIGHYDAEDGFRAEERIGIPHGCSAEIDTGPWARWVRCPEP